MIFLQGQEKKPLPDGYKQLRTVSIISGKSSTLTHFKTVTLVQTFNENTIFLHLSSSTLLGFAFPIFLLIMGTVEGD